MGKIHSYIFMKALGLQQWGVAVASHGQIVRPAVKKPSGDYGVCRSVYPSTIIVLPGNLFGILTSHAIWEMLPACAVAW